MLVGTGLVVVVVVCRVGKTGKEKKHSRHALRKCRSPIRQLVTTHTPCLSVRGSVLLLGPLALVALTTELLSSPFDVHSSLTFQAQLNMAALTQAAYNNLVPSHCDFAFPPFPRPPPGVRPLPFDQFTSHGLTFQSDRSRLTQVRPAAFNALAGLNLLDVVSECQDDSGQAGMRNHQASQRSTSNYKVGRDGLAIIHPLVAWSIGDPRAQWEEPECSYMSRCDL